MAMELQAGALGQLTNDDLEQKVLTLLYTQFDLLIFMYQSTAKLEKQIISQKGKTNQASFV